MANKTAYQIPRSLYNWVVISACVITPMYSMDSAPFRYRIKQEAFSIV